MATKEIKSYSLSEMKDKYIGKVGTPDRDEYEYRFPRLFVSILS